MNKQLNSSDNNNAEFVSESKKIVLGTIIATIACGAVFGIDNLLNGQNADAVSVAAGTLGFATLLYIGINQLESHQNSDSNKQ